MTRLLRRQQSSFTWGFNDVTGLTLPECGSVQVFLNTSQLPGEDAPAAPYTFIAYPAGGIPSVTPLTLDGSDAQWTVVHPAGTELILNIADANGNSGGVPPEVYTVTAGKSTSCLPSTNTPALTMKIDEPSALKTCTVLPIHLDGGQKPYTITLATADSIAPTNRTLGKDDDTFEWVNQSAPNSRLVIAVSDSNGQYAISSKIFTTSGSTDASCPGQSSRSYNSKDPNGTSSPTSSSSSSSSPNPKSDDSGPPIAAIVGGVVGGMILLGLLVWLLFRRKSKSVGGRNSGVGMWDRQKYKRPSLDHSPDGSQAPLGESVHHSAVQPTPFIMPTDRFNAALSYYGDSSDSAQTPPSQYPARAPPASPKYQQALAEQQRNRSFGQQSGYPLSPTATHPQSLYPPSSMASSSQRGSQYAETVTAASYRGGPGEGSRTSMYDDGTSRYSTYTVQNPSQSAGGSTAASAGSAASRKAAEAAKERERQNVEPAWAPPAPPHGPQVYQHEDAGVIELPPAYREFSNPAASPPPPGPSRPQ